MAEIKTAFDATDRGKEILRQIGYTHGKASVAVIREEEDLWEMSALTTNFIEINMIIDGKGFLKKFTVINESDKKNEEIDPESHKNVSTLDFSNPDETLKSDEDEIFGCLPSLELEIEDNWNICIQCTKRNYSNPDFCTSCGHALPNTTLELTSGKNDEKIEELNNKAYSLSESHKYEESMIYYDKALEINPSSIITLFNKASTLFQFEKYEKAIACYEDILKTKPKSIITIYKKGITLQVLEKYDDALTCFENILKMDSENIMALNCKGIELGRMGKIREEIACYDKALEINPDDLTIIENKENALKKL